VDPSEPVARFDIGDRQLILEQEEWSPWVHVQFPLIPWLQSAAGMFRIYVKQLHPRFQVYISPVNIDPDSPELPITDPPSYSRELAYAVGPFYTQGIAQDTAAYRQHVFTRAEYERQSREVSKELLKILRYGLQRFHDGVLFFHFFGVDQNSHMLWGKYEEDLLDTYKLVDRTVGWVEQRAGDATLIVMSDHGFTTFDRAVNLNTWLRQQGFLVFDDPSWSEGGELFEHVDWSRTKAYSIGLNALYVNELHREKYGIVAPGGETETLLKTIQARLQAFRDPGNGKPVIYEAALPFAPGAAHSRFAPDMVVGYYPGYRSSWETALGATPSKLIVDNTDEWRGDHCIAPEFVPGTLITNRPVKLKHPHLYDLTVTMLSEFRIAKPPDMVGQSIF
jgi:predicted AlkP superfamily phosphohydrolase/phosphomutase